MGWGGWRWKPYVPAAEQHRRAANAALERLRAGIKLAPVKVQGREIARTFWGQSWCRNLESYSDFANRLPRGRTYLRSGRVIDLQIEPGTIHATVSGSDLYEVELTIAPVKTAQWSSICKDCAGGIDSLIELLQGRLSKGVMERICRQNSGLFPSPGEMDFSCSCPDSAWMCKHVAAALYGVGARLDSQPELLFLLRGVNQKELIANAGTSVPVGKGPAKSKILASEDLADVFGLDLGEMPRPVKKKKAKRRLAKSRKKKS